MSSLNTHTHVMSPLTVNFDLDDSNIISILPITFEVLFLFFLDFGGKTGRNTNTYIQVCF